MDPASIARLVLLSAIWGASFLFIRVGAPALGPALLIFARVGLAALFLLAVALHLKQTLDARRHWRHYLMLGLFNSALPFLLFAYAAQTVSASLLSILNATAPIWAAAIAAAWTRTRLAPRPLTGLLLGIAGVALLAGVETLSLPAGGAAAILAALGAAFCYGFTSAYARSAAAIEPFANAHGSMWAATLLLIPAALFAPWPASPPDGRILLAVVALGVLCSGVAYLLYFRLVGADRHLPDPGVRHPVGRALPRRDGRLAHPGRQRPRAGRHGAGDGLLHPRPLHPRGGEPCLTATTTRSPRRSPSSAPTPARSRRWRRSPPPCT